VITRDSQRSYEAYLAALGESFDSLDVHLAMSAMVDWYVTERALDAVPLESDGDMLLFQWAIHDAGDGERFEIGLTRQFVVASDDEDEDEDLVQLSATFRFEPSEAMRAIDRGHRWCHQPTEADALRTFISEHPATRSVLRRSPVGRVLLLEYVG